MLFFGPHKKRETEVQFPLQQIHLSCYTEASLNYHFAGKWWEGDTSTPHTKEQKNASVGNCKIQGDGGAGERDLSSSLNPHVCVLVLDNPRISVEGGAGCPFA